MDRNVILVVDPDDHVRRSSALLLSSAGYTVRECASAESALAELLDCSPACVIADGELPGMPALELVATLRALGIQAPLICMTAHADVHLAVGMIKGGAFDVLEKPVEDGEVLRAVVAALSAGLGPPTAAADLRLRIDKLSRRERQVLEALVQGGTNRSIAARLGLSPRTVEIYRAKVMLKMDADSLSVLVRQALKAGVVAGREPGDVVAALSPRG